MTLKIGDIVRLKSGGPKMTVTFVQTAGLVKCLWFVPLQNGWGDLLQGEFLSDGVETV